MPHYLKLGSLPKKRHIAHKAEPGYRNEGIYYEEVVTTAGFGRAYSIVYHLRPPTRVRKIEAAGSCVINASQAGEVHGLVVARAPAQALVVGARGAFHEDLHRTSHEPLGAFARAPLDRLQQALHPFHLHRVRHDSLGDLGGLGAAAR